MKLPQEVKILNHTYRVIEVDKIEIDLAAGDVPGDEILGLLDDTNLQILIAKNTHESRKAQVFLHELVHAVLNIIDARRLLRDPEAEESIVNAISDILLQILTENQFKFPKKYVNRPASEDTSIINNIMANHKEGVCVDDICKAFHIEAKEVKKIIKKYGETKGKDKVKKKTSAK